MAAFQGSRAKHARAREHLKTLDTQIQRFIESDPYDLRENLDRDTCIYEMRLSALGTPVGLGPLIGDILHNLRSALDYVIWDLTIANGNTPPPPPMPRPWKLLQFPLFAEEPPFRKVSASSDDPLWGLSDTARAFVDDYQPFHGGDRAHDDALWVLHELSNIDKHRSLHLTASFLRYVEITTGRIEADNVHVTPLMGKASLGMFKGQAVLMRFRIDPPKLEMDVKAEVTLDVVFDEGTEYIEALPVRGSLRKMVAAVGAVLRDARKLLRAKGH